MNVPNFCRAMLIALSLCAVSTVSHAGAWSVGVSVAFPPPALPVYEQPPIPGDGYLWTPGYWAYDGEIADYYWVPGTWVLAPSPGYLWTPGYWGAEGAYFAWHAGYWGPEVGFYGGINYGFGYLGIGFCGGYWHGRDFFYNRAFANVTNVSITNVYNNTTIVNNQFTNSRVSFNGSRGGTRLRANIAEQTAARAAHLAPTDEQRRHESTARSTPALRAAVNHGQPSIAATAKPAVFAGRGPSAPRTDRPAWAARGTAQLATPRAATTTVPAAHAAAQDRPGASYGYRPGTRYGYQAARAPAQRSTPPAQAAPTYRYAARETPRSAYAARASMPPREYARGRSFSAPPAHYAATPRTYSAPAQRAYSAPAQRTYSAPHANGGGARRGPLHS